MPELRMKSFEELIEAVDIESAIRYYPHLCQNCRKPIPYFKPLIKHCNIAQDPSIKLFCSIECRDRWFLESRTNNGPALNDLNKNEMKIYGKN